MGRRGIGSRDLDAETLVVRSECETWDVGETNDCWDTGSFNVGMLNYKYDVENLWIM